MFRLIVAFLITFVIMPLNNPLAKEANDTVNIKDIQDKGFKNVGDILKQMSPEQLQEVMNQAKEMMPQIQGMTQDEIDSFTDELLDMDSGIDVKSVNVQKLDPSKSRDLQGIKNDIHKYNKQHKHK